MEFFPSTTFLGTGRIRFSIDSGWIGYTPGRVVLTELTSAAGMYLYTI